MSEIDRVFARLGTKKPASDERRETVNVPRRGATGSRVVEVVHVRSGAEPSETNRAGRTGGGLRAATWSEGFPAKASPAVPAAEAPAPGGAPAPTTHVMPGWQPASADPAPPAPAPAPREKPRAAGLRRPHGAARRVADPFDTADEGANCLRCGYAVEPEREARGLLACAACDPRAPGGRKGR